MGGWFGGGVPAAALSVSLGCVLYNADFDPDSGGSTDVTLSGSTGASASISAGTSDPSTSASDGSTSGGASDAGTSGGSTSGTSTGGADTGTGALTDTGEPGTTTTGNDLCMNMTVTVYADVDMDGHGDPLAPIEVCPGQEPDATSPTADDCNDANPNVHPGFSEICDGVDNDCNGLVDEYSNTNVSCTLFGNTCILRAYGGHFYYACKDVKQPGSVNDDCKELVSGAGANAYHVKIDNSDENQQMTMLAAMLPFSPTIGLRDTKGLDSMGDHKWTADGSGLVYGADKGVAPWAPLEPNSGLLRWVAIDKNSLLWVDIDELLERPFICEAEPAP
ncbi:MAG: hypothetical protein H6711_22435 [Myxococcales bacterium]|nr:hypothetical protein [Myxococcales bacterium]